MKTETAGIQIDSLTGIRACWEAGLASPDARSEQEPCVYLAGRSAAPSTFRAARSHGKRTRVSGRGARGWAERMHSSFQAAGSAGLDGWTERPAHGPRLDPPQHNRQVAGHLGPGACPPGAVRGARGLREESIRWRDAGLTRVQRGSSKPPRSARDGAGGAEKQRLQPGRRATLRGHRCRASFQQSRSLVLRASRRQFAG